MAKLNVEVLISAVESRPLLWQNSHEEYKKKKTKQKHWNEIGKTCDCSGAEVKAKWNNLKDTYRRLIKKTPVATSGSETRSFKVKWPYFQMMSFLKESKDSDVTEENLRDPEELPLTDEEEISFSEMFIDLESQEEKDMLESNTTRISSPSSIYSYNQSKTGRKRSKTTSLDVELIELKRERLNLLKEEAGKNDNDDVQFFKSLLPFMAKFDDVEKLEIRSEIQNLIISKFKKNSPDKCFKRIAKSKPFSKRTNK